MKTKKGDLKNYFHTYC